MRDYEILVTGAVGAGVTTAIKCGGESSSVVSLTEKAFNAVGLDFSQVSLSTGDRLHLFGASSRSSFRFLWKMLAQSAKGTIILMDNSRPHPMRDLSEYLDEFPQGVQMPPCVLGIGRMQTHPAPSLMDYVEELARRKRAIPVLGVDVRQRADVLLLIDALLPQIDIV